MIQSINLYLYCRNNDFRVFWSWTMDIFHSGELVVGSQTPTIWISGHVTTASLINSPVYLWRKYTTTAATLLLAVTRFIPSRLSFALPLGGSDVASGFTGLTPLARARTRTFFRPTSEIQKPRPTYRSLSPFTY